MSANDNLNLVKDAYLAYRDRDMPALMNCLADNVKWFSIGPPESIPTAGTRYGRRQVEQYFATLKDTEEVGSLEPREFIAEGDKVVAIGVLQRQVKSTGSVISSPWIHVFTLQDGKIAEFRSFYDTAAAIEALENSQPRPAGRVRSETLRRSFL
jgi:ketosteroid isomerase-like protein